MQGIIKGAGVLLLFCMCALFGWLRGEREARRAGRLDQMARFLGAVQSNLRYRCDTTEAVLREAAQVSGLPFSVAGQPDRPLPERVQAALFSLWEKGEVRLLEEEKQRFTAALAALGACGAEEETATLVQAQAYLRQREAAARCQAVTERRVYRALGLSGGACAVLLIW